MSEYENAPVNEHKNRLGASATRPEPFRGLKGVIGVHFTPLFGLGSDTHSNACYVILETYVPTGGQDSVDFTEDIDLRSRSKWMDASDGRGTLAI